MANKIPVTPEIAGPGTIRRVSYAEVSGEVAIPGIIPSDNTKPQITEGTQFLNLSVTPLKIGNKLIVEVEAILTEDANTHSAVMMALFKDAEVDALASSGITSGTSATFIHGGTMTMRKQITIDSLSTINFTVRGGGIDTGSCTLNRLRDDSVGTYNCGDTMFSSIKVTEIEV